MEVVSIKFEESFLRDMKGLMKKHRYATKAEFIREALRDKLKDLEKEEALMRLEKAYGAGKKKRRVITDKDIHIAREKATYKIAKELGLNLN